MTELEKYIATKKPIKSSELVRYEMEAKAKATADRFEPDDPKRNELGANFYLLAMYEMLELIYN